MSKGLGTAARILAAHARPSFASSEVDEHIWHLAEPSSCPVPTGLTRLVQASKSLPRNRRGLANCRSKASRLGDPKRSRPGGREHWCRTAEPPTPVAKLLHL